MIYIFDLVIGRVARIPVVTVIRNTGITPYSSRALTFLPSVVMEFPVIKLSVS